MGAKNKAKNKGRAATQSRTVESKPQESSNPPTEDNHSTAAPSEVVPNGVESNGSPPAVANAPVDDKSDVEGVPPAASSAAPKQGEGEVYLYPVTVKLQAGEKLELQLSPGDSVMDIRQFLLDAPETCFYTCYDLVLHTKDGQAHPLEDYNEISEVADITTGGCSIEMIAAFYDERSVRSHIRRARDLLSMSTHHPSLSTVLALQQENAKKTDAGRADPPDPEGLGFMEDVTGSLGSLISPSPKHIACVDSITFSTFNPPPSYRRLSGDLIYMDVVTLEGNKLCITGNTKSFFVNSSSGNILDPRPNKQHHEATTFIGLLQKISLRFKKGFREILDRKSSSHPFEFVTSLLPSNPWLGCYPVPDHRRNPSRSEESLVLSFGSELMGMQRDWNEELQSCREFPHNTVQERILRDRALYKVSCDFVDAATKGAVGVINKCIPPINPTDPECFHMYVHNNIFFSFAVDADIGQLSKDSAFAAKIDLCPSSATSSLEENESNGKYRNAATAIDHSEISDAEILSGGDPTSQGSAETQMVDGEQATYASANNDLKGTRAYQEADVPGLYNLAMAIIDYRGHRVVAQSIIPGILQGDKSDSLLYGSVDNGKKISWNETFHMKVLEAAKRLHIKEHLVLDGSGNPVKLAAPVECKGIVGSDDRHYLLDLMRVTPRDVNYSGSSSRFSVLRPELVSSFCQAEASQRSGNHVAEKTVSTDINCAESASEKAGASKELDSQSEVKEKSCQDVTGTESMDAEKTEKMENGLVTESNSGNSEKSHEEILLNPNVFTEFKMAGNEEEIAADEAAVRNASSYLVETVLPKFVQDLCSLEISPMDGQTLTDVLHAHGINVRYLGRIATMTKHLPHLWDLCTAEVIVRSAKHILKDLLRETPDHDLAAAICHFMNCFMGNVSSTGAKSQTKEQLSHQSSRKSNKKPHSGVITPKISQSSYIHLNSDNLWSQIKEFLKLKYQLDLPEESRWKVRKVSVIRNMCLKVGISVAARKYDLGVDMPFQISDILDLQPVVKHSVPVSSEAKKLIEMGKARLAEGLLPDAYTSFSEAFSLLQQITGPMHREVANCCRYLAMVLYHAGDMAGAITQQHKELIINERCLGLDHPDTAHSYGNMALFYHGLNQTELALRHMARTLLLLSLSSGPDHPDVAATFINVAMMYQDIGKMNTALRYLQEALKKNERLLGPEHIQTAVCYHALAIAFNCMGAYKLSLQHEKKTHDIFVKQLGEEDSRTRDSDNWIKTFKMRELQANAQKQKSQAANVTSAQKALDILKSHPDLLKAFQAAAASSSGASPLGLGDSLPRGRGFDERAARAAAEVRKKAQAKGLLVRPQGVPVQATPHLEQLLNIINAGASPDASADLQADESRKGATDGDAPFENGSSVASENESRTPDVKDQAPVGLGMGLSSLDSKKQKQKPKA